MKTNDEIEILDFLEQQINNLEEYDLLTRRGLVAKHFKEARQKILDLKDKRGVEAGWTKERKKGSVRSIKTSSSVPVQKAATEYDIWS